MCKKLSIELVNCKMSIGRGSSYMFLSDGAGGGLDLDKMIINAVGEYAGNVNIVVSVEEVPNKTVVNNQWNVDTEINENLLELNQQYKETISELTSELDVANDEVLRLENKISDMQCEGVN